MSKLEHAIQNWKRNLRSNPAFEDGDIAELESHLRDEIERLKTEGLSEEEAFEKASDEIGEPEPIGDELYKSRATQKAGPVPPWRQLSWIPSLLPNYLKVTLRNISRNKGYTFINMIGLSLGVICCLLIALWIADELGYDTWHYQADQIYRVVTEHGNVDNHRIQATTAAPVGPALEQNIPGVTNFVRFRRHQNVLVQKEDKTFYEQRFFYADSTVFDVFDFELASGNPHTALREPGNVVISEAAAQKYFGDINPVGEQLRIAGREYEVTGVAVEIPSQSHFTFDFLASFSSRRHPDSWTSFPPLYTYILVADGVSQRKLEPEINRFTNTASGVGDNGIYRLQMQPLQKIHLHSNLAFEIEQNGNIIYIYLFATVALFILIIAIINYINLATARSVIRAKEVGLRKVLGAKRKQLVTQFLGEAIIFALGAVLIAILFVWLVLPFYNDLADKTFSISILTEFPFSIGLIAAAIVMGLVAGLYPAFVLSGYKPVHIIKGMGVSSRYHAGFMRALVTLQFVISIILISGAVVIYTQLDYILNSDPGYAKERIIVINTEDTPVQNNYELLKQDFLGQSGVTNASASLLVPSEEPWSWSTNFPGSEVETVLNTYLVDYDFIDTYDLQMVAGRSFMRERSMDSTRAFIINETAVREFGWVTYEEALGRELNWGDGEKTGEIIGVVKDFHLESMHKTIDPMVLHVLSDSWMVRHISVKITDTDISYMLSTLKNTWDKYAPGYPFDYFFIEDFYNEQYQPSIRTGRIVGGFSVLAILIACLGLLGITAYMAERRKKEIGIRKVHGATIPAILMLLSRNLMRLIFFAFLVAAPAGYLIMNQWLNNFAYRIEPGIGLFLLSGFLIVLIALLSVGWQSIKAAIMNPIESLRSE